MRIKTGPIDRHEKWFDIPKDPEKGRILIGETGQGEILEVVNAAALRSTSKGARCYDAAPCGHWETVTILSSVRLDGTTESVLFDGAAVGPS
ncbi:MAG: hypothetical protein LBN96_01740 [Desulfovibrio sp.]|jgi:hypothetical protein|nr:hypothetical protein [Desulfovibrio sp.]